MERVLWVDDDPNFLFLVTRTLNKRFPLETCTRAEEALGWIAAGRQFAVIISDMRMPGMDGREFLRQLNRLGDNAVRVMFTGLEEQAVAQAAINEGRVFRFLTKSASESEITEVVHAAMQHYLAQRAEREVLESTLVGAVKALMEVLALTQPSAFSCGERIRLLVTQISRELGVSSWEIELAALLSQLGCVGVPQSTMERLAAGRGIDMDEQRMFENHPEIGAALLRKIPRMENVAEIIQYQHARLDGTTGVTGQIPLGSRVLKAAIDFDRLCSTGIAADAALVRMGSRGGWYDPVVLDALQRCQNLRRSEKVRLVTPAELELGMVLSEDLLAPDGSLVALRRQEVTLALMLRLKNRRSEADLPRNVMVFDAAV
jgi:response regulator RpfG family c-di-GMP phosphodiesterase